METHKKSRADTRCPESKFPPENDTQRRIRLVIDELDEIEAWRRVDEFFTKEAELLELTEVLGIYDNDVLQRFVSLGFSARTAPAIELAPVVFVAWASGGVTENECAAAVSAIHESHLSEFPDTLAVVQTWLDTPPRAELWELWVRYTHCRLDLMDGDARAQLYRRTVDQARRVAGASGGWLGIGSTCQGERLVLDGIDRVFRLHHESFPGSGSAQSHRLSAKR